jgi:hypothetical protein
MSRAMLTRKIAAIFSALRLAVSKIVGHWNFYGYPLPAFVK